MADTFKSSRVKGQRPSFIDYMKDCIEVLFFLSFIVLAAIFIAHIAFLLLIFFALRAFWCALVRGRFSPGIASRLNTTSQDENNEDHPNDNYEERCCREMKRWKRFMKRILWS